MYGCRRGTNTADLCAPDPYYAEVVQPDEEEFFDFSNSKFTVGWEETYVDASKGGEVAESVAGKS